MIDSRGWWLDIVSEKTEILCSRSVQVLWWTMDVLWLVMKQGLQEAGLLLCSYMLICYVFVFDFPPS